MGALDAGAGGIEGVCLDVDASIYVDFEVLGDADVKLDILADADTNFRCICKVW